VKAGTGTLSLTAVGSTANVTLTAGTLDLSSSSGALAGSTLTITGGTVNFGGQTSAAIGALAGSGNLALGSTGLSLTVGGNGASTTYSGVITSNGGQLIMNGTGTLTLAGDSTSATSGLQITQGTVALATPNAAAGYMVGLNGGTLSFGSLLNASLGGLEFSSIGTSASLMMTNTNGLGVTLTVGAGGQTSFYTGSIGGLGTLVKARYPSRSFSTPARSM
jgi:hypothetical protein